jgi:hypothetical protein
MGMLVFSVCSISSGHLPVEEHRLDPIDLFPISLRQSTRIMVG